MRTKLSMKKKTAATITAGFLVAGTAAGAYAYWTTTGQGTGTATNAASNGNVVLHAAFNAGLTPGGSSPVTFTADNAGSSSLWVETIHLASVSVDTAHSTCVVADFTMPDVSSKTRVLAGATAQALAGSGTVSFADTAVSQDPCKGATITLNLTSN